MTMPQGIPATEWLKRRAVEALLVFKLSVLLYAVFNVCAKRHDRCKSLCVSLNMRRSESFVVETIRAGHAAFAVDKLSIEEE